MDLARRRHRQRSCRLSTKTRDKSRSRGFCCSIKNRSLSLRRRLPKSIDPLFKILDRGKPLPGSALIEADGLADSFRKGLQDLLVPQKNGLDLGELALNASEPFIGSRRLSHQVCLEAGLVVEEDCQRFLQPSVAAPSGHSYSLCF